MLVVALVSYSGIKAEFDAVASASKQLKLVTDPKLIEQLEAAPNRPLSEWTDEELLKAWWRNNPRAPWVSVARVAGIAFGIPLAVLILGSSLVWALSGFAVTRN